MVKTQANSVVERLPGVLRQLMFWPLIVYCSWFLGQLSWWVLWKDPLVVRLAESAESLKSSIAPRISLAALDLFGQVAAEASLPAEIAENAPQTRLSLQLHGLVLSEQAALSGAIVSENSGEGVYYKVGEVLPGNAELMAVEVGRILLKRAGRVESLAFEEVLEAGMGVSAVPVQSGGAAGFVAEASRRLAEDANGALLSIGLRPTGDAASGYVYDGSNPMLSALNMKPGDVVVAVNGHNLGNIQQDRSLIQQWYEQGQVEVEVERDGTRFSVTYPFR